MKKKLTSITLIVLILINVTLVKTINSYGATNKCLEDMTAGDEIKFAGKEWIILDPNVGFIILASNDGIRNWHGEINDANNEYVGSDIRKYLNGEFLESLGEENKDLIMDIIWNCGLNEKTDSEGKMYYGEASKNVRDKVGLLTCSEYRNHSKYYNSGVGVLNENDWDYMWWLSILMGDLSFVILPL